MDKPESQKESRSEMGLLLTRFTIERILVEGNSEAGEPSIHEGFNKETGDSVLIKIWSRNELVDDHDLLSLWQNEIRQMQQLSEYPGARDYLVPMHDAATDSDGFYLILESDGKLPLVWHQRNPSTKKTLTLKSNARKSIWLNLVRIAKGLNILHARGLIHRNLDERSIFTEQLTTPDYQLGGFEWNIRLNAYESGLQQKLNEKNAVSLYSFERDWKSFGELALRLIGIEPSVYSQKKSSQDSITKLLNDTESHLLKQLVTPTTMEAMNGEAVIKKIGQIITEYSTKSDRKTLTLHLIYIHNKIARQLRDTLIKEDIKYYDVNDHDSLMDFLHDDLLEPELLELKVKVSGNSRYALVGNINTYFLEEHQDHGWHLPILSRILQSELPKKGSLHRKYLPNGSVKIITPNDIRNNPLKLKAGSDHWDAIFESPSELDSEGKSRFYKDAFSLLYIIEGLQQAAEIWSVSICKIEFLSDGKYEYIFKHIEEDSHEKLSNALGLKSPIDRLIEAVEIPLDKNDDWIATTDGRLASKNDRYVLLFIDIVDPETNDPGFKFVSGSHLQLHERMFIRLSNGLRGLESMRRRRELILKLNEYESVVEICSSPLVVARQSFDDKTVLDLEILDSSKQKRMYEIFDAMPIYFLQGPPGVGKTYLVTELVKQLFINNPSSRILISAQGHDAVDNIMEKVFDELKVLDVNQGPLMVRSKADRDTKFDENIQIKSQAHHIVNNVLNNELFGQAPNSLQEKLLSLEKKISETEKKSHLPDKAFESLILRSANLIFTTTNSKEMYEMVNSSSYFDWSIVEEAGRASGSELLAPLTLSHRRLLIGDPKQLPSFGEDKVKRLLENSANLKKAVESAQKLMSNSLNDVNVDELLEKLNDKANSSEFILTVSRMLSLFGSLYSETIERQGSLPLAGQLTEQHRMHPDIADMISEIFYDVPLSTSDDCIRRLKKPPPFHFTVMSEQLAPPIIVIDMPHVHQSGGQGTGEETPAHHNPAEVTIVIKLLSILRASKQASMPPSIAVLSPYNQQVKRLRGEIYPLYDNDLSGLKCFRNCREIVHTIDSFQGKESDLVIISLVRNNTRSWKKGLGILGDPRRMNVLLSRSKFKVIIIGSLEFLRLRFIAGKDFDESDELYFLKAWLDYIDRKSSVNDEVPPVSIIPCSELGSGQL